MNFTSIGQINHITQGCNQKLKQIENSDAMMIYVLNGEKHVECSGEHFIVKAGQLMAIPANTLMNVTNLSINDQQYKRFVLLGVVSYCISLHYLTCQLKLLG